MGESVRWGPAVLVLVAVLLAAGCSVEVAGAARPAVAPDPPPLVPPGTSTVLPPLPAAAVPGWSVVRSMGHAAVYDVPPTWTVDREGLGRGFGGLGLAEQPGPSAVFVGTAVTGKGLCPTNLPGLAGLRHYPDRPDDLGSVSAGYAQEWALAAYDISGAAPAVQYSPPRAVRTVTGAVGVVVEASVTLTRPASCGLTTATVWVVSVGGFPGALGPIVSLIVIADRDVPGAPREEDVLRMLTTLRPFAEIT